MIVVVVVVITAVVVIILPCEANATERSMALVGWPGGCGVAAEFWRPFFVLTLPSYPMSVHVACRQCAHMGKLGLGIFSLSRWVVVKFILLPCLS